MPWTVRKSTRGGYDTVKKRSGKVVGHHASKAKAEAQLRALYASESGAKPRPKPKKRPGKRKY